MKAKEGATHCFPSIRLYYTTSYSIQSEPCHVELDSKLQYLKDAIRKVDIAFGGD